MSRWRAVGNLSDRLVQAAVGPVLRGRRVTLRPLRPSDFLAWQEVRRRNGEWLTRWEPRRPPDQPDVAEHRRSFEARCEQRDRERSLGVSCGFGLFVADRLAGEVNLNNIVRGAAQYGDIGYWIDQQHAGSGYTPEGVVAVLRHAFEDLGLHRIQIAIVPRNAPSRRVVAKLELRDEGTAMRFLEINGAWEDHVRYAITVEEWHVRRNSLTETWLSPA